MPTRAPATVPPRRSDPAARIAIRGDLLDFGADPAWGDVDSPAVRWRPDHWLLVESGRIVAVQAEAPGEGWLRHDHAGRLVLPGFIDTHVHSPQLDVIGSYGSELLDWLTTHTYPAEARHADAAHAEAAAAHFLDALLAHGTTSAVVFPTVHAGSVDALFAAAEARGMRVIAGKVLMDRNAPADLVDDVATAEREMEALIARWHGRVAARLRGDGALRADELARAARARRAPLPRRPVALPADASRREPRRGALGRTSCFRERAAISTSTPRSACCTRRASSRTASGSTTRIARRSRRPARRSPTRRRRTSSSAAACSAGAPPRRRASTSAWRATSAAARACRCCATWPTPTRSRRSPASG